MFSFSSNHTICSGSARMVDRTGLWIRIMKHFILFGWSVCMCGTLMEGKQNAMDTFLRLMCLMDGPWYDVLAARAYKKAYIRLYCRLMYHIASYLFRPILLTQPIASQVGHGVQPVVSSYLLASLRQPEQNWQHTAEQASLRGISTWNLIIYIEWAENRLSPDRSNFRLLHSQVKIKSKILLSIYGNEPFSLSSLHLCWIWFFCCCFFFFYYIFRTTEDVLLLQFTPNTFWLLTFILFARYYNIFAWYFVVNMTAFLISFFSRTFSFFCFFVMFFAYCFCTAPLLGGDWRLMLPCGMAESGWSQRVGKHIG